MNSLRRLFSLIFLIWCFLVFTSSMILVLPFILLSTALQKGKSGHQVAFIFLRIWAFITTTLCFYIIRSHKHTEISSEGSYIFISNHNSYLDAVAMVASTPLAFKPLGKIEMLKAPIFGMIYKRMVVMINRKDKESRAQCVEDLKKELLAGLSILIFPEGTMNRTSKPLAEFYDGAFRLAIETQTPIVPVAILNARNLMPRKSMFLIKPGIITCIYGKPVTVDGLTESDIPALKENVHQVLESMIIKGKA